MVTLLIFIPVNIQGTVYHQTVNLAKFASMYILLVFTVIAISLLVTSIQELNGKHANLLVKKLNYDQNK